MQFSLVRALPDNLAAIIDSSSKTVPRTVSPQIVYIPVIPQRRMSAHMFFPTAANDVTTVIDILRRSTLSAERS